MSTRVRLLSTNFCRSDGAIRPECLPGIPTAAFGMRRKSYERLVLGRVAVVQGNAFATSASDLFAVVRPQRQFSRCGCEQRWPTNL